MEVSACRDNVEPLMGGICSKISDVEVYSAYLNISTLQLISITVITPDSMAGGEKVSKNVLQ